MGGIRDIAAKLRQSAILGRLANRVGEVASRGIEVAARKCVLGRNRTRINRMRVHGEAPFQRRLRFPLAPKSIQCGAAICQQARLDRFRQTGRRRIRIPDDILIVPGDKRRLGAGFGERELIGPRLFGASQKAERGIALPRSM